MVAVAFLATVLVVELAVRALAPWLPDPVDWPSRDMEIKLQQMTEIERSGEVIDVVFAGSSVAQEGFDPIVFNESMAGLTSYNASVAGAISIPSWRWWTNAVVVPLLRPDIVVIGISSVDVNSGAEDRFWPRLTRSGGYRKVQSESGGSWAQEVVQDLEESVAFLRYRTVLRDPAELAAGVIGAGEVATEIAPYGAEGTETTQSYNDSPDLLTRIRETNLSPFQLDGPALDQLTGLIEDLQEADTEVLLVDMPVTDDYLRLHPDGEADYLQYQAVIEEMSAELGVHYLDMSDFGPTTAWFRDPFHLNALGAEQLTIELTASIASGQAEHPESTTQ